jgi:hypothetical protein
MTIQQIYLFSGMYLVLLAVVTVITRARFGASRVPWLVPRSLA